jgi:GTP-binding protein
MFFDVAKINVRGGAGGKGCAAMRREYKMDKGGPSGGNGGKGGDVYVQCDTGLSTLSSLQGNVHHRGKDGSNGRGDSRHGERGCDCIVKVPRGTIVRDENGNYAGELNNHGDKLLVAKGGKGGRIRFWFFVAR